MRWTLLFFMLASHYCFAQDWQLTYDKARNAFQQEKFQEAVEAAEQAYKISQSLDPKNQAYSLQILTASCVQSDLFEKGLSFIDLEINHFKRLEEGGKNFHEALSKKAKLLTAASRASEAAAVYHELLLLQEKSTGKSSYEYYKTLSDEAGANLIAKEYEKARLAYDVCLPAFKTFPDAGEDYFFCLFNSAFVDHYLKNNSSAENKLSEFISIADKNGFTDIDEYTEAKKLLSSIHVSTGKADAFMLPEDKARQALQAALASQNTNVAEALKQYAACEQAIVAGNLINNTSFSCYLNHSRLLFAVNDITNAEKLARNAKVHAEKLFKPGSKEFGHLHILEADILFAQGKNSEAANLYQLVVADNKEPASLFASQIKWMGEQLIHFNLDDAAMKMLGTFQKDPSFENVSLNDKIVIYKTYTTACLGALQSVALIKDAEQKLTVEKDPDVRQTLYLSCANARHEAGELTAALQQLRSALSLQSKNIVRGELLFELARISQKLGDYREAELNYRKAIEQIPTSLSPASFGPQVYNSFATFYIQLGNYEAAENLFIKLLENKDNALFRNTVRQNLAALYDQTGKYEKAKSLLTEAIRSDREQLGDSHPDYAIALQNLATLYQKTNKLDSAEILFEQALAIDRKNSTESSVGYAAKLANLGAVYQESGNFARARQLLEQSLAIRKKLLSADHPDYAFNLYNLGFLLYRTGQSQAALPYLQESATYYLKQIKDVFPVLSDYERTAFYNKIQPVIDGYQSFLVENVSIKPTLTQDLLNFRLETKALLLSASVKVRNQILNSGNNDLMQKFAVWQHTKEQLAFLYSLPLNERQANSALISEYLKKANDLEKLLSLESESFASTLASGVTDWKKIQSTLMPGEAALEIIRVKLPSDSILYAGVLIKPGVPTPQLIVTSNGEMLEGRGFRRYMNGIRFEGKDMNSFDIFWRNFDAALKDVKVLHMSPDGVYNKINCHTFFDPSAEQFVIDRLQIQLVCNLKDLLLQNGTETQEKSAVLVGYPDFDLGLSAESRHKATQRSAFGNLAEQGVADLPGTLLEVTQIDQTLKKFQWNVQLHTGNAAREEVIKGLKNPGLLHIATHGFFITPSQENPKHVSGNDLSNIENNVMLRSGLLLAGVEKFLVERSSGNSEVKSDDGVLTAYEVMNLDLDKTELVILSACETGAGDVKNGEGVYGLQRAFMLAGVKNLIMSLWKVDDSATQELMTTFYSAWAGGKDEKTAFYETQLAIKQKLQLPYYWGAFVGVGNR